jgi:tol-pal system protein YbgF
VLALFAGVAGALAGPGCGHSEAERGASVTELNRTVQSLRGQNTAYAKQVEELENRVFILSDQLDSKKVNTEKVANPTLPKVTLHPTERTATTLVEDASDPSEVAVEYAGEAAKSNGKRPLLRLYGDDVPVMSTDRERAGEREHAEAHEPRRLIVVPSEARQEPRPTVPKTASGGLDLYRRSLDALRAGRHVEAAAGFRDFLKQHPNHDFADNAQYWLGECYYDQKDYPMAMREFRRVVEKYPEGNKVPDALLKVAFAHLALGSAEVGRQTLEQVIRSYPRHEAAMLANAKLAELGRTASKNDPRSRSAEEAP